MKSVVIFLYAIMLALINTTAMALHFYSNHSMHPRATRHHDRLIYQLGKRGRSDLLRYYYALPYSAYISQHNFWVSTQGGRVPYGAKSAGYFKGLPSYRCRVDENNSILKGQLIPGQGCIVKIHNTAQMANNYEVLVK